MIFEDADTMDLRDRSLEALRMVTQGIFTAEADTMSSRMLTKGNSTTKADEL